MPLGTSQMTITTGANFIPELWLPKVIMATEANLVFAPLTWDWSEEKGDTLRVPDVDNLTATAKAANTQVALNAPTQNITTLNTNRHDECSFLLEDITRIQASYNMIKYYTDKTGYSIGRLRDERVNALVSGFTQVVGVAGTDLGDTDVRNAIQFLDLADVPQDDRHMVIYPTQKNALSGIEKYYRADITGTPSPIANGRIGELYNVPLHISTNIGTSATARLNAMFHREAFATAKQGGPRTQSDYILEYLGDLVVTDCIYGELLARNTFGVWMRS